jgi:hypothetical protein
VTCKVRDALTTRYVAAVQDLETARAGTFATAEEAEKKLTDVRRELREHDADCDCQKFPASYKGA